MSTHLKIPGLNLMVNRSVGNVQYAVFENGKRRTLKGSKSTLNGTTKVGDYVTLNGLEGLVVKPD